jgi:trimeric autotransporter adhesin
MTSAKRYRTRTLWTLGLMLCLLSLSLLGWRAAGGAKTASPAGGQNSLAGVLNADGSLKPGVRGSFDVSGYRMEYTASGAPRFVPAGAAQAECNSWDPQFSLNGTRGTPFGSGPVYALLLSGSDLYVGGDFTIAGNVRANYVAKFDTITNTWSALGSGGGNGVANIVRALAVNGSDLYVGGDFTQANVGGTVVYANRVAKFDTTTNTWSALGSGGGNGVNNTVYALALNGSDLYMGGEFTQAYVDGATVSMNYVAKFNTTTNIWSTLGSGGGNGVGGGVRALAVSGNNLYVGGGFIVANAGGATVSTNCVAKFDTTTNTWSALGSGGGNGVNDIVWTLAVSGSDLYVGGGFIQANVGGTTVSANRVAKFNTATNTWSALGSGGGNGVSSIVYALAVNGSDLYVGGGFTQANVGGTAVNANRVAKFNTSTNAWSALGSGGGNGVSGWPLSDVIALAVSDSKLYAGGNFTFAGNVPANHVAKFNMTTNTWSAFDSVANGVNRPVYALLTVGSDLYVGGLDFTYAGNVLANRLAKFNTTTNTWSALGTAANGVDSAIHALALIGSDLYVGGEFWIQPGVNQSVMANRVAKFNTATNTWSALGSGGGNGVNGDVRALAVIGSDLYLGGNFTQANVGGTTVSVNYVAKYNTATNTWSALGSGGGNGVSGAVSALAVNGSDLYVGGGFTQANVGGTVVNANRVAKFDTTTNTWSALGSGGGNGVNPGVSALAVSGSNLYVGGGFTQANVGGATVNVNRVAKFDMTTSTWSALGAGGGNGVGFSPSALAENDKLNSGISSKTEHTPPSPYIAALAVNGSDLYVGGGFLLANVGGAVVSANNVAKFDTTTNTWSALSSGNDNGVYGTVSDLALNGGDLYLGGSFSFAAGNIPSSNIGRFGYVATLSKNSQSFAAQGGTGNFSVTVGPACQWTAASNDLSFITVTAPAGTVTGPGTVSFTVGSNGNAASRSGTITVANQTFTVRQGAQFLDVPVGAQFYEEIGKLSAAGITQGCGGGNYCPDALVTREQIAAFIIRALHPPGYVPLWPASQRFADVPSSNPFYAHIEEMAMRQITLGCGGSNYCPTSTVTREQIAAFIIRALHDPGYVPPTPTSQRFLDVPSSNPFYAHIEELAVRGITLGCGGGNYCPTSNVMRGQMAAFLVRAFGL